MTLYKSFVQPHLEYGDIIYDQPFNNSFQNKTESIQYSAWFGITGTISEMSKKQIYEELGLESLFNIVVGIGNLRILMISLLMNIKHNFFENAFLPSTKIEWNKLDPAILNSGSFNFFKENILNFIRPAPNSVFHC